MIFVLNTTLIEQLYIPFRNLENYIWRVLMVALIQLTIKPLVNGDDKYYVYCHIVYYITSLSKQNQKAHKKTQHKKQST
jgi:cell division protein FtsB